MCIFDIRCSEQFSPIHYMPRKLQNSGQLQNGELFAQAHFNLLFFPKLAWLVLIYVVRRTRASRANSGIYIQGIGISRLYIKTRASRANSGIQGIGISKLAP